MLVLYRTVALFRLFSTVKKRSVYLVNNKPFNEYFHNRFALSETSKYTRNMSQKSITAFFSKTSKNNVETEEIILKENKSTKRQRVNSSGGEGNSPKESPNSSKTSAKKKSVKRQRIDSSSSEELRSPMKEKTISIITKNGSPGKIVSPKDKKKVSAREVKEQVSKVKNIKAESPKKYSKTPEKKQNVVEVKNELDDIKGNLLPQVTEVEYNPSKSKYDPILDACWAHGDKVPYLALARTLEEIESISARLKIIEVLSNYFRSVIALTPEDLLPSVYLCLNQLAPAYHSVELGVAETYLMKAIGQCTGRTLAQVRAAAAAAGDLGLVAQRARSAQRTVCRAPPLALRAVLAALRDVARMTGQASVNKKIAKIQSLYVACRHSEARYLIRSLAGKLRVGLAEQSVLQALAVAVATTPPQPWPPALLDVSRTMSSEAFKTRVEEYALTIKTTYCECPNYERVVPTLLEFGVEGLRARCRLRPGVPPRPMLAHPTKGLREIFQRFDNVEFTCEWKYDGERAQIHVPCEAEAAEGEEGEVGPALGGAKIFSRNQEDNTSKYPDVLRRLPALLGAGVTSCVLDCEAVAYDTVNGRILPFQILSTRKRKAAAEADIKVQVCVFVFDVLYLNGAPLVREPLARRRALLRDHFREAPGEWQFATSKDCSNLEEVQEFLEEAVRGSCEGLMVKTLAGDHATYEIAKRSHNWLKLKKDYLDGVGDTIDAVVLGAYRGRGRRAGAFGGFLLACHDPDTEQFQALCKIGTGFSDDDLQSLSEALREHVIDAPKNYYRYDKAHEPDAWFAARAVWEVRCADLSLSAAHRAARGLVDPDKGVSLRFPRFVRVRDDKTPEQATSAQQIAQMYLSQDQVKNQGNRAESLQDDFY